jgi:hypothetical protein
MKLLLMNDHEKYLFDVNGYLVIEDILTAAQVAALNEAIDRCLPPLDTAPATGLNQGSARLSGTHGRRSFGGCLDWPAPWCDPFRELMALPAALRYMVATIGDDLRFEGLAGICNTQGSEGQILHGGGVGHAPDLEQGFFHRVEQGRIRNGQMAIAYLLTDVNPGDGGFCCIPGSHKASFFCSWEMRRLEVGAEFVRQVPARAGSAILFTEALTHGALPWSAAHERRVAFMRYGPGIMAFSPPAPPDTLAELSARSPLHAALLKPPSFPERSDFAALLRDLESAAP